MRSTLGTRSGRETNHFRGSVGESRPATQEPERRNPSAPEEPHCVAGGVNGLGIGQVATGSHQLSSSKRSEAWVALHAQPKPSRDRWAKPPGRWLVAQGQREAYRPRLPFAGTPPTCPYALPLQAIGRTAAGVAGSGTVEFSGNTSRTVEQRLKPAAGISCPSVAEIGETSARPTLSGWNVHVEVGNYTARGIFYPRRSGITDRGRVPPSEAPRDRASRLARRSRFSAIGGFAALVVPQKRVTDERIQASGIGSHRARSRSSLRWTSGNSALGTASGRAIDGTTPATPPRKGGKENRALIAFCLGRAPSRRSVLSSFRTVSRSRRP